MQRDQLEINQVEKSHLQLLHGDRRLVRQGEDHRTGAGEGLPHVMVVPADGPGRRRPPCSKSLAGHPGSSPKIQKRLLTI